MGGTKNSINNAVNNAVKKSTTAIAKEATKSIVNSYQNNDGKSYVGNSKDAYSKRYDNMPTKEFGTNPFTVSNPSAGVSNLSSIDASSYKTDAGLNIGTSTTNISGFNSDANNGLNTDTGLGSSLTDATKSSNTTTDAIINGGLSSQIKNYSDSSSNGLDISSTSSI